MSENKGRGCYMNVNEHVEEVGNFFVSQFKSDWDSHNPLTCTKKTLMRIFPIIRTLLSLNHFHRNDLFCINEVKLESTDVKQPHTSAKRWVACAECWLAKCRHKFIATSKWGGVESTKIRLFSLPRRQCNRNHSW